MRLAVPLALAVAAQILTAPQALAAASAYHVDSKRGDDNADGSASKPWRSLDKVNSLDLKPGDVVNLKRGGSWTGPLTITAKGTKANPITIRAYGSGATPKISGDSDDCVVIKGNYVRVIGVRASGCRWAGFELGGDHNELAGVVADHNIAGVLVTPSGSRNTIRDSVLSSNNKMSVNDEGGDNDSGAFGVLLNGDDNLVTHNTITGSFATSHDYKTDGAAVEIFNGDRNRVTHNISRDNETFTELGAQKGKTATGNIFAFNVVTSSRKRGSFLVTRGPKHVVGPVKGTIAVHNSVYLPARETLGFSCHDGCSPSILKLRNNAIHVGGQAGYEDGKGVDDAGGVYKGRSAAFKPGRRSVLADPLFTSRKDLRPRAGSPVLGRGVALSPAWYGGAALGKDMNGRALSSRPDAGAYQH